ncbi:MAG: NADPH-dependent F420 reductase [Verrucomicrobiota bacterium]|jgi:predicted dinucleotide-binding enzyme
MNIGIIGAGNVGGALGKSWAKAGHKIKFGVRNPADPKHRGLLDACGPNASTGTNAEASAFGEVIAVATPWDATQPAISECGNLAGKVLVDCTNPLKFTPGIGLELAIGHTTSGGETVAQWAQGARVVKAFNTYGFENFADASYSKYGGLKPVMFLAGDDADAKQIIAQLAADIGFQPLDTGDLKIARLLEPTGMLWIHQAIVQKQGTGFTWGMLERAVSARPPTN